MTLFSCVIQGETLFQVALDQHVDGRADHRTLEILRIGETMTGRGQQMAKKPGVVSSPSYVKDKGKKNFA